MDRPLRILVGADVPQDPNSGAAGTVYRINESLRELGHEVDELWADDLPHRVRHGNLHYLLELPRGYRAAVRRRCAEKEYDVIQLNQPHAYLAALDHRRRKRKGVFVNYSHGVEPMADEIVDEWRRRLGMRCRSPVRRLPSRLLRRLLDRHFRVCAKACDGFLVGARDNADYLVRRLSVPSRKIAVVPQGVPREFLEAAPPPLSRERLKRLLYVGQFAFVKGPHILARIVAEVLRQQPGIDATWVCGGTHHAAARALIPSAVLGRLHMKDWMPQEDLRPLFDAHGIFVFPSFFEGYGKAPFEAMARGLCVIASNVGGMRDHIQDGVNGRLCEAGDARAFVEAAGALLKDVESARRMSLRARETAGQLTWRNCARRCETFYRELLSARARAMEAS